MKLIGLDVGTKRIGVAKADTEVRIAVPDGFINVNGQEFSEIARLSRLYNTTVFVVGLPRNNSGEETQQSAYARNFARQLAMTIPGAKIYFQDESLTSVEAEARLKQRKRNYQKGEIDAEAASIILQDCIERMAAGVNQPNMDAQIAAQIAAQQQAYEQAQQAQMAAQMAANQAQNPMSADEKASKKMLKKVEKENAEITKKNSKIWKVIAIVITVVVLVGGAAFGGIAIWYNNAIEPVAPELTCKFDTADEASVSEEEESNPTCNFTTFTVSENDTVATIGSNLEAANLIKSSLAFQLYARLNKISGTLQAGDYNFRATMSTKTIAEMIANGEIATNVFNFTILPGETIADIKARLIELGYEEQEINLAFEKQYNNKVLEGLYSAGGKLVNSAQPLSVQLEGYLYGETYQFYIGTSVEDIINRAINETADVVAGNDLKAKYAERGLTLREGIILASIIQKEAKSEDMAAVAAVFMNRLRVGMSLGSDVTATYAADLTDPNREVLVSNYDVLVNDSLYNTRMHTGLTPGPISMPSITALLAVANPDLANHSSDYYFLTGDDGKMYYSDTAEGHERNIRDYCRVLCSASL